MDESSTPDLYEVLGVARDATPQEIKRAYRRKAAELHPDRNTSPNAGEQLAQVNKAYEVLSDADKRAKYDEFGDAGDPVDQVAFNTFVQRMSEFIDADAVDMVGAMYAWLNHQQDRLLQNRAMATKNIARLEKKAKTIRRKNGETSEVAKIFVRKIQRAKDALQGMDNQEQVLNRIRPMVAEYEMVLEPSMSTDHQRWVRLARFSQE